MEAVGTAAGLAIEGPVVSGSSPAGAGEEGCTRGQ